jgi:predicted RNA-binding protein (virulence factor B family)
MLEIGKIHRLPVEKTDERGIWLRGNDELFLLPRKEAAAAVSVGEILPVFLFRDKNGQLQATLRLPSAQVGECALLTVRSIGSPGAFLDWGVEKDLLVPLSQQPERMQAGRSYLVRIALDREGRPFGSARLDDWLEEVCFDLRAGDAVELLLWTFTDLGAKVVVNHRYIGVVYRDELQSGMTPGMKLTGYVKRVREDGKLDITLRQVGSAGAEAARSVILTALQEENFLALHDQSPPEIIQARLGLSKKAFKKAVGSLYKAGLIELTPEGVRLTAQGRGEDS